MGAEPTVFFLDDDPLVLKLLAKVAKSLGLRADLYASGDEFLRAYQPSGPACLVLDVRMPGMSGLELQKRLADNKDVLPIIFLTAHADVRMAVEAMEKGAFSFLEKPFRVQELCDKVQQAVRLAQQNWRRREERERARRRLARLTPAERTVLDLVIAGKANKAVAEQLGLSVRTVEVHRARSMRKLELRSRSELSRFVQTLEGTLPVQ